ncbi:MAG TPA: Asp-tRNA(Asn)/Glu-tRNA(Gln) amidotransferase subunit GatC, partial [Firmicutes bacterium]|nr:Asp-tRNA(Asn)/Glu-tRNA(Gln) amidotransferase subunit GatC [Bacillota bacterium]
IIDYVSKLKEVDTENIEPTYHVLPVTNVFREDKVEKSLDIEEVLKNAPDRFKNFFKVPRII